MEKSEDDNEMKVCRLCLGTDSLIWVFDDRIEVPENIIDVIQITTGVNISPTDNVSQMLCSKCLHITIKMFKFRSSSIANDIELKKKARSKWKCDMDESIQSILNKYPRIILPSSIIKSDLAPSIVINKNEVINWFNHYRLKRKLEKKRKKELRLALAQSVSNDNSETDPLIIDESLLHEKENNDNGALNSISEISQGTTPNILVSSASVSKLEKQNGISENRLVLSDNQIPTGSEISPPMVSASSEHTSNHLHNSSETTNQVKRKFSGCSTSPELKKFKSVVENGEPYNSTSLVTLKYVTKSLFLCNICNGISYSAKDLKRHKMKHMKCILCKQSFRSMEETEDHKKDGCMIKNIMENLPNVMVRRCDEVKAIRDKYSSAFETSTKKETCEANVPKLNSASNSEVFLISDDDDDEAVGSKTSIKTQPTLASKEKTVAVAKKSVAAKTPTMKKLIKIKPKGTEKKTVETAPPSGTIRPNITIFGDNLLDVNLDDNDKTLLKNLLSRTRENCKDTSVQTDMPSNNDIVASLTKDKLFELKNLRQYLNYYKIPVNISYAQQYSIKYGFEPSSTLKKDRLWSKVTSKTPTSPKILPIKETRIELQKNNTQLISPVANSVTVPNASKNSSSSSTPVFVIKKNTNTPLMTSIPKQGACSIVTESTQPTYSPALPSTSPAITPFNKSANHHSVIENSISLSANNFLNTQPYSTSLTSNNIPYQVPQPSYYLIHNNTNIGQNVANRIVPSTPLQNVNPQMFVTSLPSTSTTIPSAPANIMPPPMNNFVPQRPAASMLRNIPNTLSLEHKTETLPHPITLPTSTSNSTTIYRPTIRVKSVSELT